MDKLLTNRSAFLLWLTVSWITTAEADIALWQLGGSGLEWAEHDSVAILIDEITTPGAIQPIYIQPDRSVFSYLTNWGSWTPRELGYVDGERPRVSGNLRLVDGDSTSYLAPSSGASPDGRTFTFDLAVPVPVFSFGFYTPSQGYRSDGNSLREDVVPAYELYIAAHNPNEWRQIADVQENFRPVVRHQFPRQYVRFARYIRRLSRSLEAAQIEALQISSQEIWAKGQAYRGTIGDFEIFGEGVPLRAVYKTRIFDLGQKVNFGRFSWAATPLRIVDGEPVEAPDAPVSIQVEARTGIDPKPDIYYEFTDMGTRIPVSQQRYQDVLKNPSGAVNVNDGQGGALTLTTRPKPGIRAGIEYDQDNWTFWSVPTFESGQTLGLRSGSHLQLKILLNSEEFDAFVRLDSLWIETSPTLATSVIGEVARLDDPQPLRGVAEVEMGATTEFVYDVKAEVSAADTGFDALRIRTGGPPAFKHLEMGIPLRQVEASEVVESADGLTIRLPERLNAGRNELIRVVFAAEVFDFAWTFDGQALDSQSQSLPQPVQSGDVSSDIATNTLRVLASSTTQAEKIRDLRLSTSVITPNDDDVNDLLEIEYVLLGLPRTVATRLNIHALDGRKVATLAAGSQKSGLQRIRWDGRDASGALLPTGLYLLGLEVEGEATVIKRLIPVGLAY
ncbi:MAG: hypothetical protein F4049_14905 [Gemmatimonadetes bacterium]|nr:hypothetical protein [Gemmatimonadota bacterium]MYK41492.1 hypothetical protein [Gemmatimonadota bacterium]